MRAALAVLTVCLASAPAQTEDWRVLGHGHRLRPVLAPVDVMALAVVWPHPVQADPGARRGLGAALAELRRAAADAVLPAGVRTTSDVDDEATVFAVVLPSGGAIAPADWFAALGRHRDALLDADADALARAAARSALAADDAEWLYPGDVLASRARHALGVGASVAGSPQFLAALSPAALAEALDAPPGGPLHVVALGNGVGLGDLVAAIERVPAAATAVAAPAAARSVAAAPVRYDPHPRADYSYVGVALPAPRPAAATLPFAVGLAALRSRATLRFGGYRGLEPFAHAEFVRSDFLAGDPIVMLCRRGAGVDPAGPRRELESLLDALADDPLTEGEVAAAVGLLAAEWAMPPWSDAHWQAFQAAPRGLLPRVLAIAAFGRWGIPEGAVAGLQSLRAAEVHAALAPLRDAERRWWGGVVPSAPQLLPR